MTASTSRCRLCGADTRHLFQLTALGDIPVDYFTCDRCGYSQAQEPTWLDRAYEHPISPADTGVMSRNIRMAGVVGTFLSLTGHGKGHHLDYAGGFGLFTRLMRDIGFEFFHRDPFSPNVLAVGFEWSDELGPPTVCTAFEVLEHFVNPVNDFGGIAELGPELIITSTEVLPGPPEPDWWYLAPETGQHIGFFQPRSLRHIAAAVGFPHVSIGSQLQVWSRVPIPRIRWTLATTLGRVMMPVLRAVRKGLTDSDSELMLRRLQDPGADSGG